MELPKYIDAYSELSKLLKAKNNHVNNQIIEAKVFFHFMNSFIYISGKCLNRLFKQSWDILVLPVASVKSSLQYA